MNPSPLSIKRVEITQKIIKKGGLYGMAAKLYEKNEIKSNQFIIECFEQCHNKTAVDHWGRELVLEIVSYRLDLIRLPLKELLEAC